MGKVNLVIATAVSLFWGSLLSLASGTTFTTTVPLLIPLLGTIGAVGPMLVFTNDRTKGVFEYLIAYGVPAHRIFMNVLAAAIAMVSVVDAVTITGIVVVHLVVGYGLPLGFVVAVLAYSLPMSFGSAALLTSAGMYWTSLSSPRQGMNSPLGLLPILGVAPGGLTLILAEAAGPVYGYYVAAAGVVTIVAGALVLLALESRLMPRERLLSPA